MNRYSIFILIFGIGATLALIRWAPKGGDSPKKLVESTDFDPASLPSALRNLSTNVTTDQIAERIHGLGRNLGDFQQMALCQWIQRPIFPNLPGEGRLYLINEVMDALCQQDHPVGSLSDVLVNLTRSENTEQGVRDYAIQHLVDLLNPMRHPDQNQWNSAQRKAMTSALMWASSQTTQDWAGTALQALNLTSVAEPDDQLRSLAVKLAEQGSVSRASRITAFQVCAQRGYGEILESTREVAANPEEPASLRLSAIGAIGILGSSKDIPLLRKIEAEESFFLRKAAVPAERKIAKMSLKKESVE